MAARRIYTRTGDDGSTGLLAGGRVSKAHPLLEVLGCLDELNAVLGLAAAFCRPADPTHRLEDIQTTLLHLGALVAAAGSSTPLADGAADRVRRWVVDLEEDIDRMELELAPLSAFVLPGGSPGAAALHHARTVCRRCERRTVAAADALDPVPACVVSYLNRLGDWLFVAARASNARTGTSERTCPSVGADGRSDDAVGVNRVPPPSSK